MFCPQCGAQVSSDAAACPTCGRNPAMAAAPAATAPSAPVETRTDGKAIASLVLSLVWLAGLGSLLAVIFGHISRKEVRESQGRLSGGGMALAGLIIGYIGLASMLLVVAAAIIVPTVMVGRMGLANVVAASRLKTLNAALAQYANQYPEVGYPPTLRALAPPANGAGAGPDAAGLVDDAGLSAENFPGLDYRLEYTPAPGRPSAGYRILAVPSGKNARYFYTSQDGVVRYQDGAPATANSPPWTGKP